MKSNEQKYINKRFRQGKLHSIAYYILRIFPIKKSRIVFTTFEGQGGYACNPRYIAEELLKNKDEYELIWLVNDISKTFPDGIRKVKNTYLNRAFYLSTAKVWIDNTRKPLGTKKRKGQYYIQTWHGEWAFKPVGRLRGDLFPKIAELVSLEDSKMIDYLIYSSKIFETYYKDMILYDGKIVRTGMPRVDILKTKRDSNYKLIRRQYNISDDSKILIYAPTFRGGGQSGKREIQQQISTLDFKRLKTAMESKFGGEWYIFLRLHPQLAARLDKMDTNENESFIIDVSQADDMNELISAANAFVTDYSSAAFEAMLIKIPTFIYADDIDAYVKDRGEFVCDIYNLPCRISTDNEGLEACIREFEFASYEEKSDDLAREYNVLFDGAAGERVVQLIKNIRG